MKLLIPVLLIFAFISCNSANTGKDKIDTDNLKVNFTANSTELPVPENLITATQLEEILNLHGGAIYESKNDIDPNSHTTFWRLDDPNLPNAALLVNVRSNPYPEDVPDWDVQTIYNLRVNGEQSINQEEGSFAYEPVDIGVEGVASKALRKIVWRDEHQHLYMIAFNMTKTDEELIEAGVKIGQIVDANY